MRIVHCDECEQRWGLILDHGEDEATARVVLDALIDADWRAQWAAAREDRFPDSEELPETPPARPAVKVRAAEVVWVSESSWSWLTHNDIAECHLPACWQETGELPAWWLKRHRVYPALLVDGCCRYPSPYSVHVAETKAAA